MNKTIIRQFIIQYNNSISIQYNIITIIIIATASASWPRGYEAEARTLEADVEARTVEAKAEAITFWPREASRPRPGLEA